MVGLLSGDDLPTCKQNVKDKIGGIVVTAWKFWPLVHCITYGLIPARHRILWVNSVDLVWNAILASKAQKDQPEDETPVNEEDIKESAEVLWAKDESVDPITTTVEPVESLANKKQSTGTSTLDPSIQDVSLTGSSIEINNSGEPFLVAGDEDETKIPIVSTGVNCTGVPNATLSP
jgi:hypothetical protein